MKRLAIVLSVAVMFSACQSPAPRTAVAAETTSVRIQRLLRETPLVDVHNVLMFHCHACRKGCPRGLDGYDITAGAKGHTDIARWRKGQPGAQLLNAGWTDDAAPTLDGTLKEFEFARAKADQI